MQSLQLLQNLQSLKGASSLLAFSPSQLSSLQAFWKTKSSTHFLSETGDYVGTQYEKGAYSSSGTGKISSAHITTQTVVSKEGTATLTIATGEIQIGSGTVSNILLSDGTFYKCEETKGTIAFNSGGTGGNGTLSNVTFTTVKSITAVNYTNTVGYTIADGTTHYSNTNGTGLISAGTIIPRDESNITKCKAYLSDGTQVSLVYVGKVSPDLKMVASNCISLNGTTSYGLLNTSINATTSYDISVTFTMTNAGTGIICVLDGRATNTAGVAVLRTSSTIRFTHNANNIDTGVTIVSGQVYTVRGVWNGSTVQVYVDGVLKNTVSDTSTLTGNPNCEIGQRNVGTPALFLAGKVFNVSLTLDGTNKTYPIAEGLSTTSYASGDSTKTITWSNATWSTQDSYHYNINNGFSDNGDGVKRPYMITGAYTNPAQNIHNGAETKGTMEVFRRDLATVDVLYNQSTYASNTVDIVALSANSNDEFFKKVNAGVTKEMFATSPALTGSDLAKANKYVS